MWGPGMQISFVRVGVGAIVLGGLPATGYCGDAGGGEAWSFVEDFEGEDPIGGFDRVHRGDRFSVVVDPLDAANRVVCVDVPEGEHYGGALHVDFAKQLEEEPTRAYFRYRLYFDASWMTPIGGKLPGFGGTYSIAGWGGKPSDGTNGWSARGMFGGVNEDGEVPIGSYVYHADMVEEGQTYGTGMWWGVSLVHGRWYTIEQEIQLNTVESGVGHDDGWLKAWVDGELVFDQEGLHLRDTDALKIETIWFNIYEGGKAPAPESMHLLMDDFFVSNQRNSGN